MPSRNPTLRYANITHMKSVIVTFGLLTQLQGPAASAQPADRAKDENLAYTIGVQAYIHYIPAVGMMQWRNAHFGPLGGKAGDLIVYRTTEQKMPILTPNDTTTYILAWDLPANTCSNRERQDFHEFILYHSLPRTDHANKTPIY